MSKNSDLISILDTRICDNNLGNEIIMEAFDNFIEEVFPNDFLIRLPYIESLGRQAFDYIKKSEYTFLGGTNTLSADLDKYSQLDLTEGNCEDFRNGLILCGVGWWQYQNQIVPKTAEIYKKALSNYRIHSVRDSYTETKLKTIGIQNVINTGCPSLWNLTPNHCEKIPEEKAREVVCTFTNYDQDRKADGALIKLLQKLYDTIYVWVQGPEDYDYVHSLEQDVKIIPPRLKYLDQLLESNLSIDYVGTRLHAGIRALQKKRRSVIVSIDNRATEMGRDVNLPVVPRNSLDMLKEILTSPVNCSINIPDESIRIWKSQFKGTGNVFFTETLPNNSLAPTNDLKRTTPFSKKFGIDLGTPIDRFYIEQFLETNRSLITGSVLEVENDNYTKKFGFSVERSDVMNAVMTPITTFVGNLETGKGIPENRYNCIICTQTIQVIFDLDSTIDHLLKALQSDGKLLLTASGISQISRYDYDRWGEYWRFTEQSLTKIGEKNNQCKKVEVSSYGNVATAKAFLDGVPLEMIEDEVLNFNDNDYQVTVCAILTKN